MSISVVPRPKCVGTQSLKTSLIGISTLVSGSMAMSPVTTLGENSQMFVPGFPRLCLVCPLPTLTLLSSVSVVGFRMPPLESPGESVNLQLFLGPFNPESSDSSMQSSGVQSQVLSLQIFCEHNQDFASSKAKLLCPNTPGHHQAAGPLSMKLSALQVFPGAFIEWKPTACSPTACWPCSIHARHRETSPDVRRKEND